MPDAPKIILGSASPLLCDVFAAQIQALGAGEVLDRGYSPSSFGNALRDSPKVGPVGLLIDPVAREWGEVASRLREENPRVGMVVISARPDFQKQRFWKSRADGLLGFTSANEDLSELLSSAHLRPGQESRFWLDGPRHPAAMGKTPEGKLAQEVKDAKRDNLHHVLVLLARGESDEAIALRFGVGQAQVRVYRSRLQKLTETKNLVQLGAFAARMGLLDDIEHFDD